MKFTITLGDFQKLLQKTLTAIPPKTTLPVLEHLHFTLSGTKLKVIATDQDITIITTVPVVSEDEGKILVPGRRLNDIIKLQDKGDIEFEADPADYDITLRTASGVYQMKGLDADEYLNIPELFENPNPLDRATDDYGKGKAEFKRDELVWLASKTSFAVSTDEFRPAMTGVFFQFRGEYVNTVATDSYRLVVAKSTSETERFPKDLDIIIPAKSIEMLKKIDADPSMTLIENHGKITHARFETVDSVFITKVIDEKFPPYESVLPSSHLYQLYVNQKDLAKAISRVSIQTSTMTKHIRLIAEQNSLAIIGKDEESGTIGDEKLECEFNGERTEIGFNFKYLLDAVQNLESENQANTKILLKFSEPSKPVILKNGDDSEKLTMLVMPVRIS
jgi:DNA polymerase-3 subunit beta